MNCQPIKDILRYHKIDCYALHTSTTRKNRFSKKNLLMCVTQPDLSGDPVRFEYTVLKETIIIIKLILQSVDLVVIMYLCCSTIV